MPARTVKLEAPQRTAAVQSYVVEIGKGLSITLRHFFVNWPSRVPWILFGVLGLVGAGVGAGVVAGMSAVSGKLQGYNGAMVMFAGVPAGLGLLSLVAGLAQLKWLPQEKTYLRLVPYPDVPADYYPPRYRGEHRLMHREDGSVRCVSCMMCSTVCPADCINIVAADAADPPADKTAVPDVDAEKFPVRFEIDQLRCVVCGMCVEACPCDAIRMDSNVHVTAYANRDDFLFDRARLMKRGELSKATQGGHGPGWRDE